MSVTSIVARVVAGSSPARGKTVIVQLDRTPCTLLLVTCFKKTKSAVDKNYFDSGS